MLDTLTTIAEILGALAGFLALGFSLQANRIAQNTQRDARQHQSEEIESLRRSQAAEFQAWWVVKEEAAGKKWGLFISHNHPGSGVIYEVTIKARTKMGHKAPCELKQLPPANYFLESSGGSAFGKSYDPSKWENIIVVPDSDLDKYHPVTNSSQHVVDSLEFSDALKVKWEWKQDTGLVKVKQ